MKEVLKDFANLTGLWIAKNGDWYFEKPINIETEFKTREEILKLK
jgi:hypothetical protein